MTSIVLSAGGGGGIGKGIATGIWGIGGGGKFGVCKISAGGGAIYGCGAIGI